MGILSKTKEENEKEKAKFVARNKKNPNTAPSSRRKKKDPVPWGKKERYLIFCVA